MQKWIEETIKYVKGNLDEVEAGHNWFHIERVWKNSVIIAQEESVDLAVVQLGALLHDIADYKFNDGDEQIGPEKAKDFLVSINVPAVVLDHVVKIVANISFKGGNWRRDFSSKELQVVQDADRLDAIGAIGIARAFNYGGYKNREIYHPQEPPKTGMTVEEYKLNEGHTINHFYEKLLLLKGLMHTKTGKKMAEERHRFMELFLEQFYKEWNVPAN